MRQFYLLLIWLIGITLMLLPSTLWSQTGSSIMVSDEGNVINYQIPMDWYQKTSRSQMYYSADVLNLPKGTLIKSLTFTYYVRSGIDLGTGGDIKIHVGESSEVPTYENLKSFQEENMTLVYAGSHLLEKGNNERKKVTYAFNSPFEYQGGCLLIDVSNMDSPRNVLHRSLYYNWNSDIQGLISCYEENGNIEVREGAPRLEIGFDLPDNTPLLYIPYPECIINCGTVNPSAEPEIFVQVTNKGNATLHIEAMQQSMLSVPATDIPAFATVSIPVSIRVEEEGSFKEVVPLKSDGGTVELTLLGTTYRSPKAVYQAYVSAEKRLSSYNFSTDIQELSISGEIQREDWDYLYHSFTNLKYLDLSETLFYNKRFTNISYRDPMACAQTLERLSFPKNIEVIDNGFFLDAQLFRIRDLILPVGLKEFNLNMSGCLLLNRLISLVPEPSYISEDLISAFVKVYVPGNAMDLYKNKYAWNRVDLLAITQDVLDGKNEESNLFEVAGDGNNSGELVSYRNATNHTQVFYPSEMLNLPVGTKINSIKLRFSLWNEEQLSVPNGRLRIACSEHLGGIPTNEFLPSGDIYYEGSDLVDFSKTASSEEQSVEYKFSKPFVYNGGCLVLDFNSEAGEVIPSDKEFYLSTRYSELDGFYSLEDEEWGVYRSNRIPNVVFDIELAGDSPFPFIPYKNRKVYCGYAAAGSASSEHYVKIENKGSSELIVESLSDCSFDLARPVTISPYSIELVGIRYKPNGRGSHLEEGILHTNAGDIRLKLVGTTYRQAPYWNEVEISIGNSLQDNEFLRNGRDTITALSISGDLSSSDWSYLRGAFSKLRYLDLSTATIPSNSLYEEQLFRQLEQLALPMNLQELSINQANSLNKLILPVGLLRINSSLPRQLTTLISFAPEPPTAYSHTLEFVGTVYVPENAMDRYQQIYEWNRKEILPITDEILGDGWEAGPILIHEDWTYTESDYPKGTPDIQIRPEGAYEYEYQNVSLINQAPLTMKSLTMANHLEGRESYYWDDEEEIFFREKDFYASFINENTVATCEELKYEIQAYPYKWYYWSFPFDVKISDIISESDVPFVFRYYDGASRAYGGMGGNWKNVENDLLEAGKGYIFQTDWIPNNSYNTLKFSSKELDSFMDVQEKNLWLEEYQASGPDDESWNFIGNPYPSFFNIHYIEYKAPIVIWNGNNYLALSLQDDDYALRPLEAFFIQKPREEKNEMIFRPEGRQINSMVSPLLKTRIGATSSRWLINLVLHNDKYIDKSRVVINPEAKMEYELTCDAAKWSSLNKEVPQLYSLDDESRRYAINERPEGEGVVSLGFYVGKSGEYTLKIPEKERWQSVILVDKHKNKQIDLSNEAYTFYTDQGTFDDRFELHTSKSTSLEKVETEEVKLSVNGGVLHVLAPIGREVEIYTSTGMLLMNRKLKENHWSTTLSKGFYIVKVGQQTNKVIVH